MRLRKWWVRLWAPTLEHVCCGCGQWYWRVRRTPPEKQCGECRDKDAWAVARETGRPLWL